jgi:hypothetical protein
MNNARITSLSSIALILVLIVALTLLLAPKQAWAHPLGFESDLSEDRVISVCNPEDIKPGRLASSIDEWNAAASGFAGAGPTFLDVTGTDSFCEVQVEAAGDDQSDFYARLVFAMHPDRLQISPRFDELPRTQRRATITHELGHAVGLDHPTAEDCSISVMTTYAGCLAVGEDRLTNPGIHDEADLLDYWVETPIYPIPNKCWTDEDVNGDGVCDSFGPPPPPEGSISSLKARVYPQETPPSADN